MEMNSESARPGLVGFKLILILIAGGFLGSLVWMASVNSSRTARLEEEIVALRLELQASRETLAELDARLQESQVSDPAKVAIPFSDSGTNFASAARLNELAATTSNMLSALKRIAPHEFETEEEKLARSKAALSDLKKHLEENKAAAKSARSAFLTLAASLGIDDEVAAMTSSSARSHPELEPLRAYFDARDKWETSERFADILQARLTMEALGDSQSTQALRLMIAEHERQHVLAQQQLDQFAVSLQVPLELTQMDAMTGLRTPSLARFYPYLQARLDLERIRKVLQVLRTREQMLQVEQ
jgi:hypothetical protein